ncbi:MAG: lipoprotein [Rhodoferax sp.]|nr:lipoprotein [Rhodoferax sp.]
MLRLKQILVVAHTLAACVCLLTACGQTGALYLPTAPNAVPPSQTASQPPAITPPSKSP